MERRIIPWMAYNWPATAKRWQKVSTKLSQEAFLQLVWQRNTTATGSFSKSARVPVERQSLWFPARIVGMEHWRGRVLPHTHWPASRPPWALKDHSLQLHHWLQYNKMQLPKAWNEVLTSMWSLPWIRLCECKPPNCSGWGWGWNWIAIWAMSK